MPFLKLLRVLPRTLLSLGTKHHQYDHKDHQ